MALFFNHSSRGSGGPGCTSLSTVKYDALAPVC